jgi:hypothetical protein
MHASSRLLARRLTPRILVLAAVLAPFAACGGNVIVDPARSGAGTGGAGAGATVGANVGGATIVGTTGVATTAVASTGVTTTAVTSTGVTSSAASTGGPMGACTDPIDTMALAAHAGDIDGILFMCTTANLGNQGGLTMCMVGNAGLILACAACFTLEGECGAAMCLNECSGGTMNPPCASCLAAHCNSAFTACSGIPFP